MMSSHNKAKDLAKAFTDIRDRDVEARAAFDPRFDKRIKPVTKDESVSTSGNIPKSATVTTAGKVAVPPVVSTVEAPINSASDTIETTVFDPSTALYYGDSIATGLGHRGARGDDTTDAQWGRGAAGVLALMNNRPEGTFKGKDIVLSTGILNSGPDWDTVRSQVNFLQGRGARSIRLVGLPNTERYSGWNEKLQSIANETGSIALPSYTPSSDGVHMPNYSQYPVYK